MRFVSDPGPRLSHAFLTALQRASVPLIFPPYNVYGPLLQQRATLGIDDVN